MVANYERMVCYQTAAVIFWGASETAVERLPHHMTLFTHDRGAQGNAVTCRISASEEPQHERAL
jgi:hypothetical protein